MGMAIEILHIPCNHEEIYSLPYYVISGQTGLVSLLSWLKVHIVACTFELETVKIGESAVAGGKLASEARRVRPDRSRWV